LRKRSNRMTINHPQFRPRQGWNRKVQVRSTAAWIWFAFMACLIALGSGCDWKSAKDYLNMGDQAARDGKFAEAEKDYQAASRLAGDDPRVHLAMGKLYALEHKPAMGEEEDTKVLEMDPRNQVAHIALGELYAGQSQLAVAEEQYRAALALDATRAGDHLELGSILAKENKLVEAETEFRTAIGLDPSNAQAHFQLAGVLTSEPGRQSEAQAEYAQARTLDPKLATQSPAPA